MPDPSERAVLFDVADQIATVTLNRPAAYNALNLEMADQLVDALVACDESPNIRAVVLTGAGKAFCAGGDIREMQEHSDANGAGRYLRRLTVGLHASIATIARMHKPVLTAVNGPAAGAGLSMALAGDLVVATSTAKFTVAYTAIGLAPDGSSSYYLSRLIGPKRAYELIATNRPVPAAEAVEMGLINEAVDPQTLDDRCQTLASQLASGPTIALGFAKNLILSGSTSTVETAMEFERRAIATCGATQDFAEGAAAFTEKRTATFTGS